MEHPELEISLRLRYAQIYAIVLRFRDPPVFLDHGPYPVHFDRDRLRKSLNNVTQYGQVLGESLFADDKIRAALLQALGVIQKSERKLRVRLTIDRDASGLHDLLWETLCVPNPQGGWDKLLLMENLWLSRHLSSFDMRTVRLRPKRGLRILVAIANPADVSGYAPEGRQLDAVPVEKEREMVKEALHPLQPAEVNGRVTLNAILERLSQDDFDVLYLVCHGLFKDGQPYLWLESHDNGETMVARGSDLAEAMKGLVRVPRLVVLASCQSAGRGAAASADNGALAALGPRLAEIGVPAVLAMQGNVLQTTSRAFMHTFFKGLSEHGQLDQAAADARRAVREAHDHWAPVLFTRLVDGRLWHDSSASGMEGGFTRWEGLRKAIQKKRCVPILGSGILEPFVGSMRDLAQQWAEKKRYPLSASFLQQLPQVAQFLATTMGDDYPRNCLVEELAAEVKRRWPDAARSAPAEVKDWSAEHLADVLKKARRQMADETGAEPHQILASLRCPLYITTNPDPLLEEALREEAVRTDGPSPRVEVCDWRAERAAPAPLVAPAQGVAPDPPPPLVYKAFGDLAELSSVVLTEDDYFSYLINVTKQQNPPVPSFIRKQLADAYLIFLGFRIDDWDFRVFFNLLKAQQGGQLRNRNVHVAVQFDPEDGRTTQTKAARRFLMEYFGLEKIKIYFGHVEEFLKELVEP